MLNKCVFMGRLTRDIELKRTTSGKAVVDFTLAVERDYKDTKTNKRETDWIDFTAFGSTAEFVSKYFSKGRTMVADGRLQTDSFTSKSGEKRTRLKVLVDNVYFGDSKNQGDKAAEYQSANQEDSGEYEDGFSEIGGEDGELPF